MPDPVRRPGNWCKRFLTLSLGRERIKRTGSKAARAAASQAGTLGHGADIASGQGTRRPWQAKTGCGEMTWRATVTRPVAGAGAAGAAGAVGAAQVLPPGLVPQALCKHEC